MFTPPGYLEVSRDGDDDNDDDDDDDMITMTTQNQGAALEEG